MSDLGTDGLTDEERQAFLKSFQEGVGSKPMAAHSMCWMCGCDISHKAGHDCPMDDGS